MLVTLSYPSPPKGGFRVNLLCKLCRLGMPAKISFFLTFFSKNSCQEKVVSPSEFKVTNIVFYYHIYNSCYEYTFHSPFILTCDRSTEVFYDLWRVGLRRFGPEIEISKLTQ